MSRETHARQGAQQAIGDDEILDVALVAPSGSTFTRMLGAAVGGGVGQSAGQPVAWAVAGTVLAERIHGKKEGTALSIVLAISATTLYVLGRDSTAVVGHWEDLDLLAHIAREHLQVTTHHRGPVLVIDLTDTTSDATFTFESRPVGDLDTKGLLRALES